MGACLLLKVILSLGVPHSFTVSWDGLADVVVELLDAMVDDIVDVVVDGGADVVVDGAAVGLTEQYQLSKWLAESSIKVFNIQFDLLNCIVKWISYLKYCIDVIFEKQSW